MTVHKWERFTIDVDGCARCGGEHRVEFREFARPAGQYTHWASCPETGDPILLEIVVVDEMAATAVEEL